MKRIVTIQDISGVGKCSVTVALPIVSAMGVECAVMPTAVLSTHTMFSGFTFCDLTQELPKMAKHWKEQNLGFDAIYTGYLGSFEQLAFVDQFISDFRQKGNLVVIDPVMGDNGKLYTGFDRAFALEMAKLCQKADLIIPNITEACFMLDIPFTPATDEEAVKDILRKLCAKGTKMAALTGVELSEGQTGVMLYNSETDTFYTYQHKKQSKSFHGTGDLFASMCVGALMRGASVEKALTLAADMTSLAIEITLKDPNHNNYGVNFEQIIPELLASLSKVI